jgi:hypothetical protein
LVLPLLAVLLQTAPTPPAPAPAARDEKPVRVWLDPSGTVARGDPVRVYVQSAAGGYLIVMHRGTDGRIQVLFPANPADDPFVHGGTYEIRSAGDRESFVVAEPDGQGLVLAAVSPSSFRFDEFLRTVNWNPDALKPSWEGADAAGGDGVTDLVQRMLGDGYFNYDIATYTVAARTYAQAPPSSPPQQESQSVPSCEGCTFIGSQIIVLEDPLFAFGLRRFHQGTRLPPPQPPSDPTTTTTIALSVRLPGAAAGVLAAPLRGGRGGRGGGGRMTPGRGEPLQTFVTRRRVPDPATPVAAQTSAIPLRPGRRPAEQRPPRASTEAPGQAAVRVWAPATRPRPATRTNLVRLTMSPIPARGEGEAANATSLPVGLTAARRMLVPASAELETARASAHPLPGMPVTSMSRPIVGSQAQLPGEGGGAGRANFTADVAASGDAVLRTGAQANTMTRPMPVWRRGGASVAPAGGRRH